MKFLKEKHPDTRLPLVGNPTCEAFEEYKDLLKALPLNFTNSDVTCLTSNLLCMAGTLGAEAIEICNCLIYFICASEELRFIIADLDFWMANSSPLWAAYHSLMACRLVALDKGPGLRPMGICETFFHILTNYEGSGGPDKDGLW